MLRLRLRLRQRRAAVPRTLAFEDSPDALPDKTKSLAVISISRQPPPLFGSILADDSKEAPPVPIDQPKKERKAGGKRAAKKNRPDKKKQRRKVSAKAPPASGESSAQETESSSLANLPSFLRNQVKDLKNIQENYALHVTDENPPVGAVEESWSREAVGVLPPRALEPVTSTSTPNAAPRRAPLPESPTRLASPALSPVSFASSDGSLDGTQCIPSPSLHSASLADVSSVLVQLSRRRDEGQEQTRNAVRRMSCLWQPHLVRASRLWPTTSIAEEDEEEEPPPVLPAQSTSSNSSADLFDDLENQENVGPEPDEKEEEVVVSDRLTFVGKRRRRLLLDTTFQAPVIDSPLTERSKMLSTVQTPSIQFSPPLPPMAKLEARLSQDASPTLSQDKSASPAKNEKEESELEDLTDPLQWLFADEKEFPIVWTPSIPSPEAGESPTSGSSSPAPPPDWLQFPDSSMTEDDEEVSVVSELSSRMAEVSTVSSVAPRRNCSRLSVGNANSPYYLRGREQREERTPMEDVLHICGQQFLTSWEDAFPQGMLEKVTKLGEGTYGEVFKTRNPNYGVDVALKVIPVEGSEIVNGETQMTFEEITPEILIAKELSALDAHSQYATPNFIKVLGVSLVQGAYPHPLMDAWDEFDESRGSENDRPHIFGDRHIFIVFEFAFGGCDLESFELGNVKEAVSIVRQVALGLACAEEALGFEHRDLHVGNVLVKPTNTTDIHYRLNNTDLTLKTHGVQVFIVDFTLSRLRKQGCTIFRDLSVDESLFTGEGEYQFEVYRLMRGLNGNEWKSFHPKTNVLWLDYLLDKLIGWKKYNGRKLSRSRAKALLELRSRLEDYDSCSHLFLMEEEFFRI